MIDYKIRKKLDTNNVGRIFILERTDNQQDKSKTRLFWVWLSPKTIARWSTSSPDSVTASASVLLHPLGNLDAYPTYWNGNIDPPNETNFLELGARYLCKEKDTVIQHLAALRPASAPGQNSGLEDTDGKLDLMVVVPVSSFSAFQDMTDPVDLEEALRQVAGRCYEGVSGKLLPGGLPTLQRVAVSGYSRSGELLLNLLSKTRSNDDFFRSKLKEIYAFDVMLDNPNRTMQQGYDELWTKRKGWQGDDSDKKIRLYSAEPARVANVYSELKTRLQTYGGGYHNPSSKFSGFNSAKMPDGSSTYSGLPDGYEIYSTDNSRSLVVMPFGNALLYLEEKIKQSDGTVKIKRTENKNGFAFDEDYAPSLQGHSWFV